MDANTSKYFNIFYWNEANSNKPLKIKNKNISGIEKLVLPVPDT